MSRKVILYIAQSLDGYIARKNGNLDWLPMDMSPKMSEFYQNIYARIDTILMGNSTYKQITQELSPNNWPYLYKKSIVWSFTPQTSEDPDIIFTSENLVSYVQTLHSQEGKDIWVLGGGMIAQELIKHNLIDEFCITIIPVILGEGISLFPENNSQTNFLELQECYVENEMIQTKYIVKK